jgi:hypothetical protein
MRARSRQSEPVSSGLEPVCGDCGLKNRTFENRDLRLRGETARQFEHFATRPVFETPKSTKTPRKVGHAERGAKSLVSAECVAGAGGFEPPYGGIKIRCLTAWLRPNCASSVQFGRRSGATIVGGAFARNPLDVAARYGSGLPKNHLLAKYFKELNQGERAGPCRRTRAGASFFYTPL